MGAINILGSFQDPYSFDQGAARLVNCRMVPRAPQEGQPAASRLIGSPGLDVVCQPTTQPCIALGVALETIWSAHADGSIYYNVGGASPVLAGYVDVNPTLPIIRLAEDRTALCIASNANNTPDVAAKVNNVALAGTGYTAVATPTTGVTNCGFDTSINFDPSAVAELDNMTLWSAASNYYANQDSKIYSSNPLAPATVQANAYETKEARADRVLDMAVSGRVLWPLGSRSCEQHYNSGNGSDNPFQAFPNSLNSVGLAVRLTLAVLRDNIMFVGTDKRVWLCNGQSGQQVSQPWVDLMLQQLTPAQFATLTAYAYGQGGSDFYVLTLPGVWSLELSQLTGQWCYRQTYGRSDHAGRCAVEYDYGVTYVGLDTGHICLVDANSASEPAGVMPRLIKSMWVGSQENRTTYNSLDVTSSMGPTAGNFQLDWCETGQTPGAGNIWTGVRQVTFPSPGVQRAIGRQFGTGRRRQFRLQYFGTQAPFSIDELFLNTTPGT